MGEADLRNNDGRALPVHAIPRVSGVRIALGVIIALATIALTLIMLVLTLCGYIWQAGNHKDFSGVTFLGFLDIMIPVGGTCLVARLLRPSKKAVAAAAAACERSTFTEMENASLPNASGHPVIPIAPQRSGWRIAAGVLVIAFSILTSLVMLALLLLSIFSVVMTKADKGHYPSDTSGIYVLALLAILAPIGGTWLAVRVFHGPRRNPVVTMAVDGAEASSLAARSIATELEKRLLHLRLTIVVSVVAAGALTVWYVTQSPQLDADIGPRALWYAWCQVPYLVALALIRHEPQPWGLSLLLVYAVISALLALYTGLAGLSYASISHVADRFLAFSQDVAVLVFALRVRRYAGKHTDDLVLLIACGIVSAVYVFLSYGFSPVIYRWMSS
jgi:hypothetical protein